MDQDPPGQPLKTGKLGERATRAPKAYTCLFPDCSARGSDLPLGPSGLVWCDFPHPAFSPSSHKALSLSVFYLFSLTMKHQGTQLLLPFWPPQNIECSRCQQLPKQGQGRQTCTWDRKTKKSKQINQSQGHKLEQTKGQKNTITNQNQPKQKKIPKSEQTNPKVTTHAKQTGNKTMTPTNNVTKKLSQQANSKR